MKSDASLVENVLFHAGKVPFQSMPDALRPLTRIIVLAVDCAVKVALSGVLH